MAEEHVWGSSDERRAQRRPDTTVGRSWRLGITLTAALAMSGCALWLHAERSDIGGSLLSDSILRPPAVHGDSLRAKMTSLMQRDLCCRTGMLAAMPPSLAVHWKGNCGEPTNPAPRDGDPLSPGGEHVLPTFDTWKVCMEPTSPDPAPAPPPPPPPLPRTSVQATTTAPPTTLAPPPAGTPAPVVEQAPWYCQGLESLSGQHGSLTTGVGGSECRWYIHTAAANIYLNLDVTIKGPDSHVLIYQGDETQHFMHADVLNFAVCPFLDSFVHPPVKRPRLLCVYACVSTCVWAFVCVRTRMRVYVCVRV